jgi:heme oxygenase
MSLLVKLREESRAAHRQLEDQVAIMERIRDVNAYRELLQKFLGFYAPLELRLERLTGWADWGYDPLTRRKTAWLSQDLAALGEGASDIVALPLCEDGPSPDNIAAGFGCAYVLEGATLGGRQISAWLDKSEIPGDARRFFSSYGENVGQQWRAFCEALEQFGRSHPQHDEILRAASETFGSLERWLSAKTEAAS